MKARLFVAMAGLAAVLGRTAAAGPWSIEPRLGASTSYDTNPGLREFDPISEEHVAALFNLPLRYDADGVDASLTPSGRISNAKGYSSLASNYEHLDANARFIDDLGSTSVQGELARDSSLYHAGELANGVGVRRDTAMTAANWTHALAERAQVQLDAGWSRVRYGQLPTETVLVDYRYLSAGPTVSFALSERDTVKILGSYGDYRSLNGITASKSENLQLAFVRQLNEVWSSSVSAGYSRSTNSQKYFFGPILLGSLAFDQVGAVYGATLSRQGEKLNFSGGISRTLQPTGLAYLARQDGVNVNLTYNYSERWDVGSSTVWQKDRNPTGTGASTDVRYLYAQLTANWHWTPQWVVSVHLLRVSQQYGPPAVSAGSSGVSVDVTRQFLRTEL